MHTDAGREVTRKKNALELMPRAKGREGVKCERDTWVLLRNGEAGSCF